MREAMVYSNKAGLADLGSAGLFVPATRYASIEALEVAMGAIGGVVERFEHAAWKYLRGVFGAAVVGADGQTLFEKVYFIFPSSLDGNTGIVLMKAADITWTGSGTPIDPAVGGRANHNEAKAIALVDSGLAQNFTGQPLGVINGTPAGWAIVDVGEAIGVLRVFAKNNCVAGAAMRQRWR